MAVPLQDPTREIEALREELDRAVEDVVESGSFVLGPALQSFERAMAERVGVGHAVGVGSGTDALVLALEAAGVGEGDEVVTSPFSFFASAEAILRVGARPVFADVRRDTLNLDPEAAASEVTERTAALLPVHLYGQMADMAALRELADRERLVLIEDAAQAIGAAQAADGPAAAWPEGRPGLRPAPRSDRAGGGGSEDADVRPPKAGDVARAGGAGDLACFSFYPTKNLAAWGDGGMVTTDDGDLAERVRALRDHGRSPGDGYEHARTGYNSRLDSLQAAVLEAKLGEVEGWNDARREHARVYSRLLEGVDGVEPPTTRSGNLHAFHQYTVRCGRREELIAHLEEREVSHAVYYPAPLHLQGALSGLGHGPGDFPEAERAAGEVVSLPVFPLLTEEEIEAVWRALQAFGV